MFQEQYFNERVNFQETVDFLTDITKYMSQRDINLIIIFSRHSNTVTQS